jgi:flagellar biosynthesis/type III secretory pathway protein FliH
VENIMTKFDAQTSIHIDPTTGQMTTGGAARNRRIAEAGGQDQVQKKAYDMGYLDGHGDGYAEGFVEGRAHGAEEAYNRVDERLKKIENLLSESSE